MASINLSGVLKDPEGNPDVGAIVKFTLLSTTGDTVKSSVSELNVPPDGSYNIDLVYGLVRVDYITNWKERFVAIITVNADTVATSIPELLNASTPPTKPQLLQFQNILADAVAAKDAAEAAAATLDTSQVSHPPLPAGDKSKKLTIWRSADEFDIVSTVAGSENLCVLTKFKQGVVTAASSVGGAGEHYRLVLAMRLTDVYVGSTQAVAQAAGVTTVIADARDNLGVESGGGTSFDNNNLFPVYNIPQNDTIEFLCGTASNTPRQQIQSNIAFLVNSPNGSTDVKIELSDSAGTWQLMKNVNLKAFPNTASNSLVRFKLEVPAGTRKIRVTNIDAGTCHVCGCNVYRLHEIPNHDLYVDTWSYWRVGSHLYTNTEGSSDYAIYDKAQEKFMGSYHGGETRTLLRLYFDGESSISVIPTSGFKLFTSMRMLQTINIDGQLTNNAIYDFSKSGAVIQQYSMTGSVDAQVFYTNMHTTNPSFRTVWWPHLSLPAIDGANYPLGNVNTVTQRDDGAGTSVRCTFSQFNTINDKNQAGSYIWNNANYSKLYNSPIALSGANFVTVTDISFIEIKEYF